MGKKIALGAAALLVVLLVVIAMQPAEFAVERSITIQAPSEVIYPYMSTLRAWEQWSPFSKMDPQQKNAYEGPVSGVGAVTTWEGGQAGRGRATIVGAKPDREVDIRLEFQEPMQATNRAVFLLVPIGSATTVTWRLEGTNGFVAKAFGLIMDMDGMVGGEFEKGLAALKQLAENDARERAAAPALFTPSPGKETR